MARVVEMPKLSDTMEEGGIANWLKKEGDAVREGEALVEIETDKATQEYESPEEGVLLKIIVPSGKTVALKSPIAIIGEKGETFDLEALTKGKGAAAPKAAASAGEAPVGKESAPAVQTGQPAAQSAKPAAETGKPAVETGKPAVESDKSKPVPAAAATSDGRVKASPLARKVAADKGIDVASIEGSGPGGRVIVRDIEGAASGSGAAVPASGKPASASVAIGGSETVPVSMMRKTIAKRLLAAKNDAPHFYLTVSADMTRANEWRGRLNVDAEKSGGKLAKVSVNDLVILAVSRALRHHPMVNASWQGDSIIKYASVHVALAVALPEGLVTPVIRDTDKLGVRDIGAQSRDLATKAKDGKLANDAYAGGTFTISNLGMFGIEEFTAIINPPQAAILAVGAAIATPWVDAKGDVVVQQRMKMTMSCDHRVVDGSTGAQFLKTLVTYLEDPLTILS